MPLVTADIEVALRRISTSREDERKKLISNVLSLDIQNESSENAIIHTINRLFSSRKFKEGLECLNVFLNNCNSSTLEEHASKWIDHCIIQYPNDLLREPKLRVLGKIMELSNLDSSLDRVFISSHISKVLINCITTSHINPYEGQAALKTLAIAMKRFPGSLGHHSQRIEDFILIFLDSPNGELVRAAALAFLYLQQIGSGGSRGVNHKSNFTQNFHKLCATVHKLLDTFLEDEMELFLAEKSVDEVTFEFQDDPVEYSQSRALVNARRILNVFQFIEAMIKNKYPVAKETKPKLLLEVINRATSIHKCMNEDRESLDSYQFSLLLIEIQIAALKLLRLSIIWYRANCLPFSYSISKVIVDTIERSHNCDCFNLNGIYQETAYRALIEWMSIAKGSFHQQFQSQLTECILKDITPMETEVTLTISKAAAGKMSRKAKRQAMASRIIDSGNRSLNNESGSVGEKLREQNICRFALRALKSLLEYSRVDLKSNMLQDLYKSIFDSLKNLQSGKPSHPYKDSQCQIHLYEVLVAIYHQNALPIVPPLHTTLAVLNRGANDQNRFVAHICHQGLSMLESFCQPICPSLYIGLDKDGEELEMDRPISSQDGIEDDALDGRNIGGRGSVDFDASTDEFPNRNTSETQDSSFETLAYHVRYTDTDRSSVDDVLSDRGKDNEEIVVEELGADDPQNERFGEDQMMVSEFPIITAPSEDGNEILEGRYEEELETVAENQEDLLRTEQDTPEKSPIEDPKRDQEREKPDTGESESEPETTEQQIPESETLKADSNVCSEGSEISDNEAKAKSTTENEPRDKNTFEPQEHSQKDTQEVSNSNETSEEPATKKVRFMTNEDDEILVESTSEAMEDPDVIYLEDDSFVDEVKDYY